MSSVIVIRGAGDPTADLIAEAAYRLTQEVVELDLRSDRLTIEVTSVGPSVRVGSRTLDPVVVFNRTGINGLGLSSSDGLKRQFSGRWRHRHTEGREEQGVLLAVFDAWERTGVAMVNRTRAADMSLMPNSVVDRLLRADIAVRRGNPTTGETEVLICAGVPIARRGAEANTRHQELAFRVCEAAEFEFGTVRMSTGPTLHVRGWSHQPQLEAWDDPEATALAVVAAALGPVEGLRDVSPRYFVDDLGVPRKP